MTKKISIKLFIAVLLLASLSLSICFSFAAMAETDEEVRYADLAVTYGAVNSSENVPFTKRETEYKEIKNAIPRYNQLSALPNSCGATAGAIVVGFYDKYYENLIPNYTSYVSSGTYKGNDSTYIPQLMRELYTLMRTNIYDVGVSEQDCLNGLKAYVNAKSLNLTYRSVKSFNKVNESLYLDAVNNNLPTLLFCDKMDMYNISTTADHDNVVKTSMEGAHVAVGYGIYIIKYYNGDSVYRTDKYLRVATGLGLMSTCYLKMSATDWCNAAYSVTIN